MSPDGRPMILSANVTRGLGRKTSLSAALKNVFKETASFSGIIGPFWFITEYFLK